MRVHNPHVPMDQRADVVALIDTARTALTNADADPELDAELAEFGYTTEKRDEGDALLDALVAASADMAREHGEAEQSTVARDAAAAALETWFRRFRKVAVIATEDVPQLRERLGFLERS